MPMAYGTLLFVVSGIYCVDVSFRIILFFQNYLDFVAWKFFSEAAYTVYIIHPLVVVPMASIFVEKYNKNYDDLTTQKQCLHRYPKVLIMAVSICSWDGSLHLSLHESLFGPSPSAYNVF